MRPEQMRRLHHQYVESEYSQQFGLRAELQSSHVRHASDIADKSSVTALGVGRECLIKMSDGRGASHLCGCGTVGLSHSVRTSEGSSWKKKKSASATVLLCSLSNARSSGEEG